MPNDSGFPLPSGDVRDSALAGLTAPRKTLPAKLFYDEAGCRLFYQITELPEYYLTRTERALLERVVPQVAGILPPAGALVEYGASDEEKAGYLLRSRDRSGSPLFRVYVPIDIATPALLRMHGRLAAVYPTLSVLPVTADFLRPVALPLASGNGPRLGFFPGSTIGNLEPLAATLFLRRARESLGPGSHFLLGADLRKDPAILIPAYDDAAGVTAAFNLNVLTRLNREAGADFDLNGFRHLAVWNDAESRIEMHLVSRCAQAVRIGSVTVSFLEGESVHTENSYKHPPGKVIELAETAGWELRNMWTDPAEMFGIFLFRSTDNL
jgi:dimethylhistidine N-methyltransferase